jgi:hypothetical protein
MQAGGTTIEDLVLFKIAISVDDHCCPKQTETRRERVEGSRSYEVIEGRARTTPRVLSQTASES